MTIAIRLVALTITTIITIATRMLLIPLKLFTLSVRLFHAVYFAVLLESSTKSSKPGAEGKWR